MENPGGVCGVFPATCRARPLRSAASTSQTIDIPGKRSSLSGLKTLMENMVDVCGVLRKTWRVHPLRSVARATQTIDNHKKKLFIQWAQHPRVGELMENPGGLWGWGLLENMRYGDMRCAFWNLYPYLHLICYPIEKRNDKRQTLVPVSAKVYSTSAPNVKSLPIFRPKEVKTCPLAPYVPIYWAYIRQYVPPGSTWPYIICIVSVKSYSHGNTCTSKVAG